MVTMRTTKKGLTCTIEVQEAKDAESGFTMTAELVPFEFGDEHDDDRESTLIVDSIVMADAAAADDGHKGARIPKNQAAFMTAVEQAIERHGISKQPLNDGPWLRTVTEKQVLERYSIIRADAGPETREREFRRQFAQAIKREDLITRFHGGDTLVWRPEK